MIQIRNFINGQWQEETGGKTVPLYNPSTGETEQVYAQKTVPKPPSPPPPKPTRRGASSPSPSA